MSVLDDFFGTATDVIGVKSIADAFVQINNAKLANGLAKTDSTIRELTASNEYLRTQTDFAKAQADLARAQNGGGLNFAGFDVKKALPYALIAGGLYLAYRLIK